MTLRNRRNFVRGACNRLIVWYNGGMETKTKIEDLNIESLHELSLELAQKFNALYWDTTVDSDKVFEALENYRNVRRMIKDMNQGEPYRPWEAHEVMSARPSSN